MENRREFLKKTALMTTAGLGTAGHGFPASIGRAGSSMRPEEVLDQQKMKPREFFYEATLPDTLDLASAMQPAITTGPEQDFFRLVRRHIAEKQASVRIENIHQGLQADLLQLSEVDGLCQPLPYGVDHRQPRVLVANVLHGAVQISSHHVETAGEFHQFVTPAKRDLNRQIPGLRPAHAGHERTHGPLHENGRQEKC